VKEISMSKKTPLPATQFSPDGNMALVPEWSDMGGPAKVWWTLRIKSPKTGQWVSVQGGSTSMWMTDLGFNPYSKV
jgi:hypothetical protein